MANVTFENARHTRPGIAALVHRITEALRLRAEYRAAYRRTLAELQSMSDRELVDFGLHRSELPAIAHEAARTR